jgi:hypothetical protein
LWKRAKVLLFMPAQEGQPTAQLPHSVAGVIRVAVVVLVQQLAIELVRQVERILK